MGAILFLFLFWRLPLAWRGGKAATYVFVVVIFDDGHATRYARHAVEAHSLGEAVSLAQLLLDREYGVGKYQAFGAGDHVGTMSVAGLLP